MRPQGQRSLATLSSAHGGQSFRGFPLPRYGTLRPQAGQVLLHTAHVSSPKGNGLSEPHSLHRGCFGLPSIPMSLPMWPQRPAIADRISIPECFYSSGVCFPPFLRNRYPHQNTTKRGWSWRCAQKRVLRPELALVRRKFWPSPQVHFAPEKTQTYRRFASGK